MKRRETHTTLDGLGDQTILHVEDVAAILSISSSAASEMLSSGKIEGMFRVGKLLRISVKDVRAYIARERCPKDSLIHQARQLRKGAA